MPSGGWPAATTPMEHRAGCRGAVQGDIFGGAASGFGDLFGRLFGHAGRPRGEDIQVEVAVPLRQVLKGGNRVVTIPRPRGDRAAAAWQGHAEPGP